MRLHRYIHHEGPRGLRGFANLYDREETELVATRVEAYVFSGARHAGVGVSTDDDTAGMAVFAGVPHLVNVWVTAGSPKLASAIWRRRRWSLPDIDVANVRFHDRAVWWSFWHPKDSWTRGTPRWRHGSFHWWDALVGKAVHRSEPVGDPVEIDVPLPEGCYRARVGMTRDSWHRPRWPWPSVVPRATIDVISRPGPDGPYVPDDGRPGYVPVPGKGENAWDCGPDGTFGMTCVARTVEEAIGHLVASVLRDRQRHAGTHRYAEPITP